LQLWFKRLRKRYDKECKSAGQIAPKLKYYAVGEYGTKRYRPHYHIILYNLHLPDIINDTWGLGFVKVLPLKHGGTTYVMKYMSKPRQKLQGKEQEFSLMSKNLGSNYITPEVEKFHKNRVENSWVRTGQGYKIPIPRYYRDKMFTPEEKANVTEYMQQRSEENTLKQLERLRKRYPAKEEEFYIKLLVQSKELLTFDKRIQETF